MHSPSALTEHVSLNLARFFCSTLYMTVTPEATFSGRERERETELSRPPAERTATDCRELAVSFLGGFLWQEGALCFSREFLIQNHCEHGLKNAIHFVHSVIVCRVAETPVRRTSELLT